MEFDKLVDQILTETREAPEGKHYTKSGNLRSGDADADGDGGPKFRSDPTDRKNYGPRENEEDGPVEVETQTLNHRGGVTSRGYSTFETMEDLEKVLPRMKMIYQRILVNGKELGEDGPDEGDVLDDFYNKRELERMKNEPGDDSEEDAEGKIDKDRMACNKPRRTSGGSKKFVVKACKNGKEKIVRYGDPNMKIKKSNPKRRKSFRARHKCDQKKDKFSAGYWSCKKW